jgi:hypothetical protein
VCRQWRLRPTERKLNPSHGAVPESSVTLHFAALVTHHKDGLLAVRNKGGAGRKWASFFGEKLPPVDELSTQGI